jgi:hypothetical protein
MYTVKDVDQMAKKRTGVDLSILTLQNVVQGNVNMGRFGVENGERRRNQEESHVIATTPTCDDVTKFFGESIENVDFHEIASLFDEDYPDSNVMYKIKCMYQSMLKGGDVSGLNKILEYVEDLHRVGEQSALGIAAVGSLGNSVVGKVEQAFVIKTLLDNNDVSKDFQHEYFIVAYYLNKLRDHIPNFAMSFGMFECSGMVVGTKGDVKEFCARKEGDDKYIIMENVRGGISLRDVSKRYDFDMTYNFLMQVFYSLEIAQRLVGFTHYDLHGDNVLIRSLPDKYGKKAFIDYGDVKMLVPNVATMIDFGMSRVSEGDKNYGTYGLEKNNVFADRSNILYDIFKLMMWTRETVVNSDEKRNSMNKMISSLFFPSMTVQEFEDVMLINRKRLKDNYFSFPFSTHPDFNVREGLMKIRNTFPEYEWMFHYDPNYMTIGKSVDVKIPVKTESMYPKDVVGFALEFGLKNIPEDTLTREFQKNSQELLSLAYGRLTDLKDQITDIDHSRYNTLPFSRELYNNFVDILLEAHYNYYLIVRSCEINKALEVVGEITSVNTLTATHQLQTLKTQSVKNIKLIVDYFIFAAIPYGAIDRGSYDYSKDIVPPTDLDRSNLFVKDMVDSGNRLFNNLRYYVNSSLSTIKSETN